MQIFLINLARRPDRLAAMTCASSNGLVFSFARAEAITDAARAPDNEGMDLLLALLDGPLGEIPKGDKCCALSHRLAWEAFLRTGEPLRRDSGRRCGAYAGERAMRCSQGNGMDPTRTPHCSSWNIMGR